MAEPGPLTSCWSLPRLTDDPDRDPWATHRRFHADHEAEGWAYLAGCLLMGWCVTPPLYVAASGVWVCVAFNVAGCRKRRPIVAGAGADRWTAIDELAAHFEFQSDAECGRAQRRRPN